MRSDLRETAPLDSPTSAEFHANYGLPDGRHIEYRRRPEGTAAPTQLGWKRCLGPKRSPTPGGTVAAGRDDQTAGRFAEYLGFKTGGTVFCDGRHGGSPVAATTAGKRKASASCGPGHCADGALAAPAAAGSAFAKSHVGK